MVAYLFINRWLFNPCKKIGEFLSTVVWAFVGRHILVVAVLVGLSRCSTSLFAAPPFDDSFAFGVDTS